MCVEDCQGGQETARSLKVGPGRALGARSQTPLHVKPWRVNSLLKARRRHQEFLYKEVTISDLPCRNISFLSFFLFKLSELLRTKWMLEPLSSMLQTNLLWVKDYSVGMIFEPKGTILWETSKVIATWRLCFRNCWGLEGKKDRSKRMHRGTERRRERGRQERDKGRERERKKGKIQVYDPYRYKSQLCLWPTA